jgi:hypothetical protein
MQNREILQTALEFCHDLLAEWEWKRGERAGLGEEYNELLEFISTLNHEIVKPKQKPIGIQVRENNSEWEEGDMADIEWYRSIPEIDFRYIYSGKINEQN